MLIYSRNFVFLSILLFPFTLYSTDIYTSSEGKVKILANLNPHIISGDPKLGNTILVVSAPIKNEGIHLVTPCEHTESVLYRTMKDTQTLLVIQIVFPTFCDVPTIRVGDKENVFTDTLFPLQIESHLWLEKSLINTKSEELLIIMRKQGIPESTGATLTEKLERLYVKYRNFDSTIQSYIARDILRARENTKYISPVGGYEVSKKEKLIPGAGRPYRRDTTDGIHHGWDIMAPLGTPVQSLAKGKIIRVVSNWSWADFGRLKKGNITRDDRLQNLDIFRGNQVWLQTMDGNVTFYSHLSKVSPSLAVGDTVEAGMYLGNVGISGVPDKAYKDIHLHFEIQENPFREDMKNPTYLDIMRWKYVAEGMKRREIYAKMGEIFG